MITDGVGRLRPGDARRPYALFNRGLEKMVDLYDRIDEIQGMTRILGADVDRLRPMLGELDIQAALSESEEGNRRFYVRAVFALVEAVVEQHRRLLLDLAERSTISLDAKAQKRLQEKKRHLGLGEKIGLVYQTAADAFGQATAVPIAGPGRDAFLKALEKRHLVTHPKTFHECHVDEQHIREIEKGHEWFRALQKDFVRAARLHRQGHPW